MNTRYRHTSDLWLVLYLTAAECEEFKGYPRGSTVGEFCVND